MHPHVYYVPEIVEDVVWREHEQILCVQVKALLEVWAVCRGLEDDQRAPVSNAVITWRHAVHTACSTEYRAV